ncbi:unnamed protein product [Ostreobium quekettii]|uniref:Uncharacterized protein n=1 Tax=Ostreobium quekettii TaxID=121088 RepID=A0A8S1IQW3_9CHLO|nr:unnamed protein product [Ostreobium quekettii]
MEKASEIEDFRVKHGTLQANYDQLQRECKELGVRAAEAEERTADLKEELGNLLNNSDAVTTTTIMEPVEVKNPVTVVEIGDVYGTPERVDAAEGTAVQTGGVDEAYANETMEAAAKVADGDALGLLEQLNQHQEQLDEEEQQEVTEEGSLDGVIENTEEWSQQEGTPKLVRPPDLIATGGTLEGEEAADGTDTGNEEQLGYGSEDNESLLQTTKRSVLQAVLAGRED